MPHHSIDRRRLLQFGAAGAAALATARVAPAGARALSPGASPAPAGTAEAIANPFTLGVASGDPTPDGVVLWTRLAPDPLAGGGMPNRPVPVQWQVATDERFRRVVARGTQLAVPDLARRAAAFQAYYEHMPLRSTAVPRGIDIQLFRRLTFGDLVDFHMLDTRQYRSDQNQALRLDPTRTILGDEQERWLLAGLARSTARWNVFAQQVFFSQRDFTAGPNDSFSDDAWDNYVADRDGLRDHVAAVGTSNPVVLTGDVHANYVCDVKADFEDPASDNVATELVGTSISTGGDSVDQNPGDAVQLAENPHIKFINRNRGYVRNVIARDTWRADFVIVDQVRVPDRPTTTRASFVIDDGQPGAVPA
jgi:phosphodiesterase/alkaline phosphatase D-like protein